MCIHGQTNKSHNFSDKIIETKIYIVINRYKPLSSKGLEIQGNYSIIRAIVWYMKIHSLNTSSASPNIFFSFKK